jgi:hypothetical protein
MEASTEYPVGKGKNGLGKLLRPEAVSLPLSPAAPQPRNQSAIQHPAAQSIQTGSCGLANIIRLDVCTESPVGEFAHV